MATMNEVQYVGGFGAGWGLDLIKSNIDVSDDKLMAKRKKDFIEFVNEISAGITIESFAYTTFVMAAFDLFFKTDKIQKSEVK